MIDHALLTRLYEIGAIRFGQFTLKSGITSPIYIDLRLIISYPDLLKAVGDAIWQKLQECSFDLLCGVPYTALPLATYLSLQHDKPMLLRRREGKEHGIKRAIEGVYQSGQCCAIVEDLVTSGLSVFETIQPLETVGLRVQDVAVFLDRQQGALETISSRGYHLHSAVTITELLNVLHSHNCIDAGTAESTGAFIKQQQVPQPRETTHA